MVLSGCGLEGCRLVALVGSVCWHFERFAIVVFDTSLADKETLAAMSMRVFVHSH